MTEGRRISTPIISVVIPVAPGEAQWQALLHLLPSNDPEIEIVLCQSDTDSSIDIVPSNNIQVVRSRSGRAATMNDGARFARGLFLWFLHADSQPDGHALERLRRLATGNEPALFFHDLGFSKDGPLLMRINEIGVWLRSHLLRMPFGDQGFFLRKELFEQLGRFNEDAKYGEDHLLVWQAHRQKIPLRSTGTRIVTSARKYASNGWGQTTGKHLLLTVKQAAPEFWKLLRERRS